jgi:hypothetical protein
MKTSLQLHASVESKTMFRPTPWCPSTSFVLHVLLWMSATGAWRKKNEPTTVNNPPDMKSLHFSVCSAHRVPKVTAAAKDAGR